MATSIIGTQSRGGLIALTSVAGYLFFKSDRKLLFLLIIIVVGSFMIGFVPDEWFARMDTIAHANEDSSFMTRVTTWKLSFIMAIQHPFVGGGFKSLEYGPVWSALSQDFHLYSFFYTGTAVPGDVGRAAHSIYFQVLGDMDSLDCFSFYPYYFLSFQKASGIAKRVR